MNNDKLNEAINTIKELCKVKKYRCTECPMNWNCGEDPSGWKEVKGDVE